MFEITKDGSVKAGFSTLKNPGCPSAPSSMIETTGEDTGLPEDRKAHHVCLTPLL